MPSVLSPLLYSMRSFSAVPSWYDFCYQTPTFSVCPAAICSSTKLSFLWPLWTCLTLSTHWLNFYTLLTAPNCISSCLLLSWVFYFEMYKYFEDLICINLCLSSGCVPSSFKHAMVQPICLKKGLNHVRPISKLSFIPYVFSLKLVWFQASQHWNGNCAILILLYSSLPYSGPYNSSEAPRALCYLKGTVLQWFKFCLTDRSFSVQMGQIYSSAGSLIDSLDYCVFLHVGIEQSEHHHCSSSSPNRDNETWAHNSGAFFISLASSQVQDWF